MKTRTVWIDTNIIIRFITADHPAMTPEAARLMKKAELGQLRLKIPSMVIAECCWVLQSRQYRYAPSDIAGVLSALIAADGIEMDEKDVILDALELYSRSSVDFVDAYMSAHARAAGSDPIVTFNTKDFRKLKSASLRPDEV